MKSLHRAFSVLAIAFATAGAVNRKDRIQLQSIRSEQKWYLLRVA
jgi:hypothetical protein